MCNQKVAFILEILFLIQYQYVVGFLREVSTGEDMDFEKQLSILNKQPIKSFQIDGDIYDCIDIYKQPTLDHPLLKSHKIQMRPTYDSKPLIEETKSRKQQGTTELETINCSKGTVPIRRTQKEDLIRLKQFSSSYPDNIHPQMKGFLGEHVVALKPSKKNVRYNGVRAEITVHGLDVKNDQYSTAQLWIENGVQSNQYTSLQAGWMVSPHIAGDNKTRMFIYWTNDNSKTGCFNHLCRGFVQVHQKIVPGYRIIPLSIFMGVINEIDVAIIQDKVTGNWWLTYNNTNYDEPNVYIGYWPKSLLPSLDAGASVVAWGGLAVGSPAGDSPPMGNGHYPQGDYYKAAYFEELRILDSSHRFITPDENEMVSMVDNRKCYGLEYRGLYDYGGVNFMYGGPGGKCGI